MIIRLTQSMNNSIKLTTATTTIKRYIERTYLTIYKGILAFFNDECCLKLYSFVSYQRFAASLSVSRASTQRGSPCGKVSFFQKGALVFK